MSDTQHGNPSLVLNKVDDLSFENLSVPQITEPTDVIVEVKRLVFAGPISTTMHMVRLVNLC